MAKIGFLAFTLTVLLIEDGESRPTAVVLKSLLPDNPLQPPERWAWGSLNGGRVFIADSSISFLQGNDQDSLKNKAAKALNAGIEKLNSDEKECSSSGENSSSSEAEDDSSSASEDKSSSSEEEYNSSSEENSSSSEGEDDTSSTEEDLRPKLPEVSKLPTFEFFFEQEDLGIDYLDDPYSSNSNSPEDGVNLIPSKSDVYEPRSLVASGSKDEVDDEYSTFAREKDPTLDYSFEEEELGIEDTEYKMENTYFPNDKLQPIYDVIEEDELDLRRRDAQINAQNNVEKNEDCSNPTGFVVCLIKEAIGKETYESVASQFTK